MAKAASKLFKLKEWLTLDEAASHISSVLGEPATVADLYRFALDGYLILSIDFVNQAYAKKGKWIKIDQVEFQLIEHDILTGKKRDVPLAIPKNGAVSVSEDDWIALDERVELIEGVWDLAMIGSERLDIEHKYQALTSGPEVTLMMLRGPFVQRGDVICELQTDFDDNEFQLGSKARQKEIEQVIAFNQLSKDEANELRKKFKTEREEYLTERKKHPNESNYFPSSGLCDHDHVLVVRTRELTRFIQSLDAATESEKPLSTKERHSMLVMIAAICKAAKYDYQKRGIASSIEAAAQALNAPLTDDTIRKILKKIDEALEARSK